MYKHPLMGSILAALLLIPFLYLLIYLCFRLQVPVSYATILIVLIVLGLAKHALPRFMAVWSRQFDSEDERRGR